MDKAAPPPISPPPPQETALHQDDTTEEDENVKQLGDCSAVYLSLQDCLINSNRDWKSCQKEVQALKACNDMRNNSKKK
ncbi:hypothetical protein CCACVL1_30633 [Corchorus capsularis]|uniref:Cysteine alpha-hairpin motif superfamily n=1 Tax=Corchorus capsularis TaxID=210143 RepID=A0A1R3FWF7_COCAP|nr:hypothetical protein CCACVL1_30633 [Corchorus capsularis]